MSTFMNIQIEEDPDLVMKAPYIPMNMGDDLPLLISEDLMWSNSEKSNNSCNKSGTETSSSLAQLLSSSVKKSSITGPDHGGGISKTKSLDDFHNEKSKFYRKCNDLIKIIRHILMYSNLFFALVK